MFDIEKQEQLLIDTVLTGLKKYRPKAWEYIEDWKEPYPLQICHVHIPIIKTLLDTEVFPQDFLRPVLINEVLSEDLSYCDDYAEALEEEGLFNYDCKIVPNINLFTALNSRQVWLVKNVDQTYTLMYTRSFSEFLTTRQIELVSSTSLFTGLLALIQDASLLDNSNKDKKIFADLDKQFLKLVRSITYGDLETFCSKISMHREEATCYEWIDLFKFKSIWQRWFTLTQKTARVDLLKEVTFTPEFKKVFNPPVESGLIAFLREGSSFEMWDCFKIYNLFHGKGVKKYQRDLLSEFKEYPFLIKHILRYEDIPEYFNYFTSLPKGWKQKLKYLNDLLKQHEPLRRMYLNRVTFISLIKGGNIFKKAEEELGLSALGILENTYIKYRLKREGFSFENIKKIVQEQSIADSTALVEPLNLPQFAYGWNCIELYTGSLLREEGNYNKHCVGGYSASISPNCRIFSFRKGKLRHTVEYIRDGLRWKLAQEGGYCNLRVKEREKNERVELSLNMTQLNKHLNQLVRVLEPEEDLLS